MSAKVKVTLTLAEVLKRIPKLWLEVVKSLKKMGIHLPLVANAIKKVVKEAKPNMRCEPVPLNKVGYYSEGNDSNTTLLVEYNDIRILYEKCAPTQFFVLSMHTCTTFLGPTSWITSLTCPKVNSNVFGCPELSTNFTKTHP